MNNSQLSTHNSQLIPPGYKQTEVGVIPEDWEVVPLRDLVRDGPKNGFSGRSEDDTRGTATLSLAATTSGRLVLNKATVKYLELRVPHGSSLFLEPGDVLVQRSNTLELVGTTAIFDGPPATFVYPDLMMRLRFKRRVTGDLFWRYANSASGRSFFRSVAAGSTGSMPKISGEKLRQMPVPVPTKAEQEAIAEALSDADALIESLEQLLVKKRQLKQGAMQELLTGKNRLPGFEINPGYKQTEVGVIPEDWEVMPFVRAVQSYIDYRGRTPRKLGLSWGGGDILALSANNVQMGRIDYDKGAYYGSDELYRKWMVQGECEPGDVLLTMEAPLGNVTQVPDSKKYILSQRVLLIKPKTWLLRDFLTHYMKSFFFQNQLSLNSTGSTAKGIQRKKLDELPVGLPPTLPEQTAIATILSDMDAEIAALETKLAKARQSSRA